jgi:hypothetical protein
MPELQLNLTGQGPVHPPERTDHFVQALDPHNLSHKQPSG